MEFVIIAKEVTIAAVALKKQNMMLSKGSALRRRNNTNVFS
jgi:hypothetical protein